MRIRLTPQARADLTQIYQYLFERSPGGANSVLSAIYDALNLLAEHPHAAQQTEHPEIRAAVIRRYRYNILHGGLRCDRNPSHPPYVAAAMATPAMTE